MRDTQILVRLLYFTLYNGTEQGIELESGMPFALRGPEWAFYNTASTWLESEQPVCEYKPANCRPQGESIH